MIDTRKVAIAVGGLGIFAKCIHRLKGQAGVRHALSQVGMAVRVVYERYVQENLNFFFLAGKVAN